MKNKKGLTLMEILISLAILGLVMAGLMNVFVVGRRYMYLSRSKMSGGELGKYFLDNLKMDVNASTWSGNCVGAGLLCPTASVILDSRTYTPTYNVTLAGQPGNPTTLSRVRVNITWPREQ